MTNFFSRIALIAGLLAIAYGLHLILPALTYIFAGIILVWTSYCNFIDEETDNK